MPSATPTRFLAAMLVLGAVNAMLASSAHAEVPLPSTLRHSFLTIEPIPMPENLELNLPAPEAPSAIDPADAARARRGRLLLAAGVPTAVLASVVVGLSSPPSYACYRSEYNLVPWFSTGVAFTSIGLGLTSAGIVALHRASKEARAIRKTRRERMSLAFVALGSIALSGGVIMAGGVSNAANCYVS